MRILLTSNAVHHPPKGGSTRSNLIWLQYLADQDARGKGLEIALKVEGSKRRLEAPVETVLYRIAQESLTNIFRHARTQQGTITLRYETQQLILSGEDRVAAQR